MCLTGLPGSSKSLSQAISVVIFHLGVHLIEIFGCQSEELLRRQFVMLLKVKALGKNVPKYDARCKKCSLKYAIKFQHKSRRNRKAPFAPFTYILAHLCIAQIDW